MTVNRKSFSLALIWWHRLTAPSAAIKDESQRRRASLLASILLFLFTVTSLGIATLPFTDSITSANTISVALIILPALALVAVAFGLNQRGYFTAAAALTVALIFGATWAIILNYRQTLNQDAIILVYLAICPLVSSVLFSRRITVLLGGVQIAGVLLLQAVGAQLTVFNIVNVIIIMTEMTGLTVVISVLYERDLLTVLMDNIPDTIYFKDRESRFTRVNAAQTRMLGLADSGQAIGRTDFDFQPEALARQFYAEEQQIVQTGQAIVDRVEYNPTVDGTPRWFAATKVPIFDARGQVVGLVGVSRDITTLKLAENQIKSLNESLERRVAERTAQLEEAVRNLKNEIFARTAAEAKYRTLVEQLPAAIYVAAIDPANPAHYQHLYASPYWETLLGYSPQEIMDDPALWTSRLHPDDRETVLSQTTRHFATGAHFSQEYRMLTRAGSTVWVADQAVMLPAETDARVLTQGFMFDITPLKQAQQALAHSEMRFRALTENGSDGIALLSADGVVRYVSPAITRILGGPPEDWLGGNAFARVHPGDVEWVSELFSQLRKEPGSRQTASFRYRRQDETWCWLETTATNLLEMPEVEAIVLNFQDISNRKAYEHELSSLVQINAVVRTLDSPEAISTAILSQVQELMKVDGASLSLYDTQAEALRVKSASGAWTSRTGEQLRAVQGIARHILATAETYLSNDIRADALFADTRFFEPLEAVVCCPLIYRQAVIGMISIGRGGSVLYPDFTDNDTRLLAAIADIAANAIQREAIHQQTVSQVERLAALREIDRAISGSVDLGVTLNVILTQSTAQLKVDAACVLLMEEASYELRFVAQHGFRSNAFAHWKPLRLGEGYAGRAARERRAIHIPNLAEQADNSRLAQDFRGEGFVGYGCVPLIAKGQVHGVLEVFRRAPLEASAEWLDLLDSLAEQAAIAVDNARLFDNLQQSNIELSLAYDATIEGWSRALDLRDKETEGHTRRVTELTLKLAGALGIRPEAFVHIRRGALLHDIGKMGIPDSILLKPGPLTDEEWASMRRHPQYAYEMLSPIRFLQRSLDIPYCHHEKWDGTGYPRGLKGEQIPVAARLFAVVDVWDALCSDRPYRKAWPVDNVVDYIRAAAATHFDPQVVNAFLQLVAPEIAGSHSRPDIA